MRSPTVSRPNVARRRATGAVTCSRSASRRASDCGVEGEAGDRRPLVVPTAAEALRKRLPGHSTIMANAAVPGPMWVPTTAADVAQEGEVRVGPHALDHLADERRLLVVDRVDEAEVELVLRPAVLLDEALHRRQRLLEPAHLGVAGQRAVDGGDERLDVEHAADERGGAADAAAATQVLEGRGVDEQLRVVAEVPHVGVRLVRACSRPPGGRADARRTSTARSSPCACRRRTRGRTARAACSAARTVPLISPERCRENTCSYCLPRLLVDGDELAGGGLRGGRQDLRLLEPGEELLARSCRRRRGTSGRRSAP